MIANRQPCTLRGLTAEIALTSHWFQNATCLIETGPDWSVATRCIEVKNGVISGLFAKDSPPPSGLAVTEAGHLIAIPGLVNAHSHSPDTLLRGTAPDLPLELWSLAPSAGRDGRSLREIEVAAQLGAVEMLRCGTTSVLDHIRISPDLAPDALEAAARGWLRSGMRVTIAPVVSDLPVTETMPFTSDDLAGLDLSAYGSRRPLPWEEQMAVVAGFHAAWHGAEGRISVGVGPSGPQRCSDALLTAAADFAQSRDTVLHMHALETQAQQVMGFARYGCGTLEHLSQLGILSRHVNLVHALWLEPGDIARIAGAGVSVVHNPVSNARLGSGRFDLCAMLQAGVRLALGTDSACCNDGSNLLETLKWAILSPRAGRDAGTGWPTPEQGLSMASSGGADALGLAQTGRIAPGMAADLTFLRKQSPAFVPLANLLRQLVLGESGAAVDMVLIAGEVVLADGRATRIDEAALWAEAQEIADCRRQDAGDAQTATAALAGPLRRMLRRVAADAQGGCACH